MNRAILLAASVSFVIAAPLAGEVQAPARVERVQFQASAGSAAVKGEVKGRDVVDYQFQAAKGQPLFVLMTTPSTTTHFNVSAPGAPQALFVGSTSGREFRGTAPADGLYTVRVYQMPSAARTGQAAKYSLEIGAPGKTAGAPAAGASPVTVAGWPARFDASGTVQCSAGALKLDLQCAFRVVREKGTGRAEIWLESPAAKEKGQGAVRSLTYGAKGYTMRAVGVFSSQRKGDAWLVGVDGKENFLIPDAVVLGN